MVQFTTQKDYFLRHLIVTEVIVIQKVLGHHRFVLAIVQTILHQVTTTTSQLAFQTTLLVVTIAAELYHQLLSLIFTTLHSLKTQDHLKITIEIDRRAHLQLVDPNPDWSAA